MVAYCFKRQFRPPILAGIKRHTVRDDRKRHVRPGEEPEAMCLRLQADSGDRIATVDVVL